MSFSTTHLLAKFDPENGHPFWKEKAQQLVDALAGMTAIVGETTSKHEIAEAVIKLTPTQLRSEVRRGNLPTMYPWDDEIWDGIRTHVVQMMTQK